MDVKLKQGRQHVRNKSIEVIHVGTNDMYADVFTKALPRDKFEKFKECLMLRNGEGEDVIEVED